MHRMSISNSNTKKCKQQLNGNGLNSDQGTATIKWLAMDGKSLWTFNILPYSNAKVLNNKGETRWWQGQSMIKSRNGVWAVDYDLIRGFRSFVIGLVGWGFEMAIVIVIRHEFHPILCLGEKKRCRYEGKEGGEKREGDREDEGRWKGVKKRSRYGIYGLG